MKEQTNITLREIRQPDSIKIYIELYYSISPTEIKKWQADILKYRSYYLLCYYFSNIFSEEILLSNPCL